MRDKRKTRVSRKRQESVVLNCYFCHEGTSPDFLAREILNRFISERGKILSRAHTGLCSRHQRKLTDAVKRARYMALLPYVVRPE